MKILLSLLLAFSLHSFANAQDSWKIVHNGQQKLKTTTESRETNVFNIKPSQLDKNSFLLINYSEKEKQTDWTRVIAIFDSQDNELYKSNGNLLKLNNPKLRSLFKKATTIHIYTWALPTDPAKAAVVRIRRVHLATIVLKP